MEASNYVRKPRDLSDPVEAVLAQCDVADPLTPEEEIAIFSCLSEKRLQYIGTLLQTPAGLQNFCAQAEEIEAGRVRARTYFMNVNSNKIDERNKLLDRVRAKLDAAYEMLPSLRSGELLWDESVTEKQLQDVAILFSDLGIKFPAMRELQRSVSTALDFADKDSLNTCSSEYMEVKGEIVQRNLRLVYNEALRWQQFSRKNPTPFLELFDAGKDAVFRAVESFMPETGNKFSTYATHAIRNAFIRHTEKSDREKSLQMKFVEQGVSRNIYEVVSLGDGYKTVARIQDGERLSLNLNALAEKAELSERETQIISMRYGFVGSEKTLQEVGAELGGLTRERIRQIEKKALGKLRKAI